jgi:hypothetical protein
VRHSSILEYAHFRWFKGAVLICAAAAVAYLWHEPPIKPYGGTWLGYTLGTVAALLIVWLMFYGVRKRRYRSRMGTVQGWLSAHVYLGTAVVVIATLHTGFELGWNVHTLAYVLLLLVVASGFYGVYMYLRVPGTMTENLGEETLQSLLLRIGDIDRDMRAKAMSLPDPLLALVDGSISGTRLGGSLVRLVSGEDPACATTAAINRWSAAARGVVGDSGNLEREVFALLLEKQQLLQRARRTLRHKALLDLWLYIHVPLAFMLLAALTAHIVSVFVYW